MKKINATYKGIIIGALMIVLSVIFFYLLKFPVNGDNQLVILIIYLLGIIWSQFSLKKKGGIYSFKEYFSEGFKTFIVVTLFMVVYTFIFYKLNTQILENVIKENNVLILKNGDHMPAELPANADKLRNIFMPMMLAINTIKYLLLGAIVSLIGAGFFSQKLKTIDSRSMNQNTKQG